MAGASASPSLTVRPALHADDVAVQRIFEQALLGADWLPADAAVDTDFKGNSSGETVFVCCSGDGVVLGVLAVYAPGAFIHHLYVDAAHRGLGVGALLLASLDSWLPRPWRLKCVTANRAARRFYQRGGWTETEVAMGSQGEYVVLRRFAEAATAAMLPESTENNP